jgi:hypothetical protein
MNIFQYDNVGRIILMRFEDWIISRNEWQLRDNNEFSYNEDGYRIFQSWEYYDNGILFEGRRDTIRYDGETITTYSWEYLNGSWTELPSSKSVTTMGNNVESTVYFVDDNGSWRPNGRITVTFDDKKRKTEYLYVLWKGYWEPLFRETFSYFDNNKLKFKTDEEWEDGNLKYKRKREYHWNSFGEMDSTITHNWSDDESWNKSNKYIYKYDNSGNQILELDQYWAGEWINSFKEEREFNELNKLVRRNIFYPYDNQNNIWNNLSKFIFETDNYGNHTFAQHYRWEDGEFRIRDGKMWLGYNNSDSLIYFNAAQIELFYTTTMVNADRKINIKHEYELKQNYPNPFNPKTTINYSLTEKTNVKISLYDVLGNEIRILENSIKPPGNHQIDFIANQLSSGIYFYRIETEDYQKTKKMILLK